MDWALKGLLWVLLVVLVLGGCKPSTPSPPGKLEEASASGPTAESGAWGMASLTEQPMPSCSGTDLACEPPDLASLNEQAVALHRERRLKEASELYAQLLKLEPPREPTEEERALTLRYAPRLFVTPTEFFPLKDFAAVLHPERPLIAYHMFWEDDIDYPDDNDPCDHEVMWVEYDAASGEVTGVYAYYHKEILSSQDAVADANAHDGRPWIGVQWGKHGSLIVGWEKMRARSIWLDMKSTYRRLHTQGHRQLDHPLARGWPRTFEGSWDDFVDFSQPVEPREWLETKGMIMVSRWPNAVIDQYFLPYNFYPKPEWPK